MCSLNSMRFVIGGLLELKNNIYFPDKDVNLTSIGFSVSIYNFKFKSGRINV